MSSGKSKTKKKRTYRHRVGKKRNHTDTSIDVNSIHSRTLSYLSRNNNNNSNKTENNNNTTNTNSNLLTFSALPNNLSVSLPSSPINRAESTNATKTSKNKRFNVEVVNKINKLQRFSSMNNICDKKERKRMTPISRAKRKTKSSRKRKKSGENIRVMVRFRPFNAKEIAFNMKEYNNSRSVCDEIIFSNKNKKICLNYITSNNMLRRYSFKFDKIFTAKSSQKTIFNNVCKPICDDLLQFKSNRGTIFCYGQSGSGKSYTFFGKNNNKTEMDHNNKSMGVVARCCAYILNELCNIKESLFNVFTEFSYNICMECMEIYNEKLIDLLNVNSKQSPIIRERKHIEIHHITRKPVQCEADILNLLQIASVNRNMDRTALNKNSSRSHMIIRVIINSVNSDLNRKTQSILNFIDLAGSENIKKLKNGVNKKKQVVEAGNILKSLTTLSQVIDALVKNKKHIPYKESKLTRILHNSLGGNCRTALLICASANIYNRYETIRSLKFGKRCQQIKNCVKYNQGQIIQNPNQSATRNNKSNLKLKLKKSVSACSNKSVIVKDDKFDCKALLKEIEKLKVENDLLRKKEELSDNICTLNETITKIALQNAFKKNNGQKKIKNELNIFQSKLIQVTIALNAKMDQIKELIDEGQTLLINNEREGQEEEQQNEQINTNNNLLNSINFNQKIYSEAMVQQLKQKNLNLVQEIAKLKQCQSQCKLVKTPRASNSNSMSTNTAYHPSPIRIDNNINKEANDTYYICDDEDIYGNAYAYNQENGENNKQQTLSEQLNVMDAMRQMDKDNLDLLQSPIHKNKVTELPNKFDICSNSNSNSHSHRISPRDSITLLKNAHLLPSNESSARSSIKSQSVLSTTIDSIDEHLEKWNNGISANQHRLSNMEMYNRRRSSVNTAISVSLSSGNSLDLQPILCTESGTGNGNGNGNAVEFGVDAEEKGDKSNLDGGVLKEEENEEEESLSDEEYDYYSETDDDQSYYNNSFNGIHNTFHRTKTESQIFRSIGMELSKKLKAKSVESPCQNNQRLSSTFAIHWINLKK